MPITYDPGNIEVFKVSLRQIPGYPAGEALPIRAILFASNALDQLPAQLVLAGAQLDQPVVVVMDPTPMRRGSDDLKPLVLARLRAAGWQPEPLWLTPDATGQVHTDFGQINRVKTQLRPGAAVLSVGSGTVTDIAKHACFTFEQETAGPPLPFVMYQTANSVCAFTSNMAPVFVGGVKRTLPSRYPDVLVCDLETLRDAPMAMTIAGVGDLVPSFGSFADWYLAHQLGMDASHTEFARTLLGPLDESLLAAAPAIRAGSLAGTKLLAKVISLAGLAMSLSHATAPLSGYEHVISHLLDLIAERAHRPLAFHGTQVGLATLLTTEAYGQFLDEFDPARVDVAQCFPTTDVMRARLQRTFNDLDPSGGVAEECWSDYGPKLEAWHAQRAAFENTLQTWPQVRQALRARSRPPSLVVRLMRELGGPLTWPELEPAPTADEVKFAFLNAPLIRRRLTLGDLLIFLNWDREALWAGVNQALARLQSPLVTEVLHGTR